MSTFQDTYARTIDNIGGIAGTSDGAVYASHVEDAIEEAINALRSEAAHRTNVPVDYLKGWLAEQWHAETLKVSASARGRSDIWAQVNPSNVPGEDIYYGNQSVSNVAEVKYYKTGEGTAKAVSRPEYASSTKVVPADQVDRVSEAAQRLAHKNQPNRPEQAPHYQDTADNATDRLTVENASSKPISEKHAKAMAKDFKKKGDLEPERYGLATEEFVQWADIARQSGQAALHAAAFSAALSAAPHVWNTLNEWLETGEIDAQRLAVRGHAVMLGATSAGLRGGVAAGLTAACKTGLMGDALKTVSPTAIGMATIMTINVIGYSIKLQQGRLSKSEFAHHCLRDSFTLGAGMLGATAGQLFIPIPVLGALAGNLVGSTLGAVAFEGANQVVLGICIENGWTLLGAVRQDYVVPEYVLQQAGYDLFSSHSFTSQSFSAGGFTTQSFSKSSLSFTPVARGLISCNAIAYR